MIFVIMAGIIALATMIVPFVFIEKDRKLLRNAIRIAGGTVAVILLSCTSWVNIKSEHSGHMKRLYLGTSMPSDRVVATGSQMGPQAKLIAPGFQFSPLINILYDIEQMGLFCRDD